MNLPKKLTVVAFMKKDWVRFYFKIEGVKPKYKWIKANIGHKCNITLG